MVLIQDQQGSKARKKMLRKLFCTDDSILKDDVRAMCALYYRVEKCLAKKWYHCQSVKLLPIDIDLFMSFLTFLSPISIYCTDVVLMLQEGIIFYIHVSNLREFYRKNFSLLITLLSLKVMHNDLNTLFLVSHYCFSKTASRYENNVSKFFCFLQTGIILR